MKCAFVRIGMGLGVLTIGLASGCSSSMTTASNQSDDVYIVYTADGVTVGDRMGMQVKATSDTSFAMALTETYPSLETTTTIGPNRPVSTLADYPILD